MATEPSVITELREWAVAAVVGPLAAWLGFRRAKRMASGEASATAANDASTEVVELLRDEVRRLSARVQALEEREEMLRRELHAAQRLLADAGITQPAQLGD